MLLIKLGPTADRLANRKKILISTWTDMPSAASTIFSLLLAGFRCATRERPGNAA
jgi:hypothetical protein